MRTSTVSSFISSILLIAAVFLGYLYYKGDIGNFSTKEKTTGLYQSVTLREGESVTLRDVDFTVKVVKFFNEPCEGVCFWSGVGTQFEYTSEGEKIGGINRVEAFGYRIVIEETDHETFIRFKIDVI